MMKKIYFLFFLFFTFNCHSQNEQITDSLYSALDKVTEDSLKVIVYEEITQDLIGSNWDVLNKIFQKAKPALEKFPEKYYDALSAIAWTGVFSGEFEKADSIHTVLLKAYKHQPFKQKLLFLSMAEKNYMLFKLPKADSLLNFSFKEDDFALEESADLHKQLYRAYNFRGAINNIQGKFLDAEKNLKISLKYAGKGDNSGRKTAVYGNLFYANFDKGDINESLKYLQKSFDAYLKNPKRKTSTLEIYVTLLDFYTDVGLEIDEEQILFDKAQTYIEETGADYLEFDFNLILLKKYLNQKDITRCTNIINQLQAFMDKSDVRLYLPRFYEAQIKYFLLVDNKKKAQEITDNLYSLSVEQGLQNYEALSLVYQIELNKKNTEEAIRNLEKAYKLAADNDNIRIKKLSLEKLVDYYTETADLQKKAEALQEIIKLEDLMNFNQKGLNSFSNILNEVQKYLDVNQPKVNVRSLTEQDKPEKEYIYIVIVVIFILFLYFLFYLKKKENQQKLTREKLQHEREKEKELNERAIKYNKLKIQLLSTEIDWLQFLPEYKIMFPDFIRKLNRLNINLTTNTLKNLICIRMGLNTKETAMVNGVSVDAVNKAKYRIKKQLNLASNESLTSFIEKM